ncbi:hypothetical protein Bca4012_090336 [Brassica carinata]
MCMYKYYTKPPPASLLCLLPLWSHLLVASFQSGYVCVSSPSTPFTSPPLQLPLLLLLLFLSLPLLKSTQISIYTHHLHITPSPPRFLHASSLRRCFRRKHPHKTCSSSVNKTKKLLLEIARGEAREEKDEERYQ